MSKECKQTDKYAGQPVDQALNELGVDCSDKTGTLTKNEMQVAEPVVMKNFTERDLFLHAALWHSALKTKIL